MRRFPAVKKKQFEKQQSVEKQNRNHTPHRRNCNGYT